MFRRLDVLGFASGLVIGMIIGGTIGLILAGLFAAAKSDEAQAEVDVVSFKDKSKQ